MYPITTLVANKLIVGVGLAPRHTRHQISEKITINTYGSLTTLHMLTTPS